MWNLFVVARKRTEKPKIVEVDVNEIEAIIAATESGPLTPEQREKLLTTVRLLFEQIRSGKSTRKDSEKLDRVLKALAKGKNAPAKDKEKKPGHGRNGAAKFVGAKVIEVKHPELKKGDKCPSCPPEKSGKVYPTNKPNVVIRLVGMAPIQANVYKMEVLRCNLCGQTFTAPAPAGIGEKKFDESVTAMLAVLKHGSGMPRNRLAGLQGRLGIPLPQPTQWELLKKGADDLEILLKELLNQAAQGDVLHNDDTSMKILKIERPEADTRTGIFTSTVVSTSAGDKPRIALFFTGRQHAGENLRDVLKLRREGLETPTRMGDAASKNRPKNDIGLPMDTDQANCLAHARCYFVDAYENFPDECRHILEELGTVFHTDQKAKKAKMDPQQRLEYHQTHSGPVMDRLKTWMGLLLAEKKVEPNSELGVAIRHVTKNWEPLTLFLRKPGVPLSNNIAERAMKKAVLNRKNAQFYRNQVGANVGDLFLSLIHTCELNNVNPFDYLTEVLRHSGQIEANNAANWMPWTYRATLAAAPSAA